MTTREYAAPIRNNVHGFRSTFRDWAGDVADAPAEVAEAVLSHVFGGKTEQAYRRMDAFDKRKELMEKWDHHCGSQPLAPSPSPKSGSKPQITALRIEEPTIDDPFPLPTHFKPTASPSS